jgi:hypothetical protein
MTDPDQPQPIEQENNKTTKAKKTGDWKGHRRGIKSTPTTSKRSGKSIRVRQREAETLKLRLKNYSYRQIGEQTGVSVTQAERDLIRALARVAPRETTEQVFRLEIDRLDAMAAGHFGEACKGSVSHAHCMLRIIELRSRLYGLLDRDHAGAAARLVISQSNGEPRTMSVEFVLPGSKSFNLDDPPQRQPVIQQQQQTQQPIQRTRITPSPDDVVVERVLPSAWEKQHGSYSWMK